MASNLASILDISMLDYPASYSDISIRGDFLRTALPAPYNGSASSDSSNNSDLTTMYHEMAKSLYPVGSD